MTLGSAFLFRNNIKLHGLSESVFRQQTCFVALTTCLEAQVKLPKGKDPLRKGTYMEEKRCTMGIRDR